MIKRVGHILSILASAAMLMIPAGHAWAASATLYLSPSSGSVANGDTISVGIRENSGSQAVNGVQANLTYPASLFDVANIISSSAFSIVAQNSYGNGSIQLGRGALPSVTGDQLVATVVFKAKASSGSAAVSFASGSQVAADDGSGTNILSGTSGGSYSLTAGNSTTTGGSSGLTGGTSGSGKKTSGSTGGSTAPTKDTTPPTISAVKAQSTSTTTAVITWTTSEPATSEVDYGINNGYGLVAIDGNLVTDHKLTLNSPILSPGNSYHFMVKSVDAAGNQASATDQTFRVQGAILNVTVLNQKSKPVAGALVSFAGQSVKTDKNGQARLTSLPAGELTGFIDQKGTKTAETVNITNADPARPQKVTFKIHTSGSPVWLWALVLLAVLSVLGWWLTRRRHLRPMVPEVTSSSTLPDSSIPSPSPEPTIVDPSLPPPSEPPTVEPPAPPADEQNPY